VAEVIPYRNVGWVSTVAVELSVEIKRMLVLAPFEDVKRARTVVESNVEVVVKFWVRTAVAVSPVLIASAEASIVIDDDNTVACDGATERTPRPNAATATSAMRLNVVFVDICFLSIVELRTIRGSALKLVS